MPVELSFADQVAADNAAADAAAAASPAATPPEAVASPAVPEVVPDPEAVVADPALEPDPNAPPVVPDVPDPQDVAFLTYAAEQLGNPPWLQQFTTAKAFLAAVPELQSLVGRQAQSVAALRKLEESGFTAQEYAKWLMQKSQPPAAAPAGQPAVPEWDAAWVARGGDGKVYPTAAAPADWEARFNRQAARMQEALLDPAKMAAMMKPFLTPDIDQAVAQTRQEVAAQAEARAQQDQAKALFEQYKPLYYTPYQKAFTAFGTQVDKFLNNPQIARGEPYAARLQAAHNLALEMMPQAKPRVVPKNASPMKQPAVNPGKKVSADDWVEKHGGRQARISELQAAIDRGEVEIPS